MNKKILLLPLSLFIGILISCGNLEVPETISVKTNAKYSFSMGNFSYPTETAENKNGLSVYDLIYSNIKDSLTGYEVVDYNPNGSLDVQQIALKVPFQSFDIDFEQYLNQVDFKSKLGKMDIAPISFTIPTFGENNQGLKKSQEIPLTDINDTINKAFFLYAAGGGPQTASVEPSGFFDSIEYTSGKLVIKVGTIDPSDYSITVDTSVTTTITVNGKSVNIKNGVGELDLAGVTILSNSTNFDLTNINLPNGVICTIKEGSQIKVVTGLTYSQAVEVPINQNIEFDVGNNSALKSMVIDVGTADVAFKIPNEWANVTNSSVISITSGLTKNGNAIDFTAAAHTVDLHDAVYKNEKIVVEPTIKLEFSNSTIDFSKKPSFDFDISITQLQNIKIGFQEDLTLSQNISYDLPTEVLTMLKEITWENAYLDLTVNNRLPSGNDIDITISSGFLDIASTTETFSANSNSTKSIGHANEFTTKIGNNAASGECKKIDLTATINLGTYANKELTLYNVTLGETYSIEVSVEPKIEWKKIKISKDAIPAAGEIPMDLKLGDVISSFDQGGTLGLKDKLKLSDLTVHLFCDMSNLDEVFDNPTLNAQISIVSGDMSGGTFTNPGTKKYIAGDSNGKKPLDFKSAIPVFTKKADGTFGTYTQVINSNVNFPCSDIVDEVIKNGKAIQVEYDVDFVTGGNASETIELSRQKIKETGSVKLDLCAVLVIPFSLELINKIELADALTTFGVDLGTDLLQRQSAADMNDIKQYADLIKTCELCIKNPELPIELSNPIELEVDFGGSIQKTTIQLMGRNPSNITIPISPSELLNTYPIKPTLKVTIPAGDVNIPRNIKVKGSACVNIQMDGDKAVPIWKFSEADGN